MRYFLYGYYGCGNFGDDLLLGVIVRTVRQNDPGAVFYVKSRDQVAEFSHDDKVVFTCIDHHLEGTANKARRLVSYLSAMTGWIKKVDVFLIGGGTLFIDKGKANVSILLLYLSVLYAKMLGRKVVITGVAVDTLTNPLTLWATRKIFSRADFIALRDALSLPYASHCLPEKVRLAADLVFGIVPQITAPASSGRKKTAAFCFIDYFRTLEKSAQSHAAYEAAITGLIETHSDRYEFCCLTLQRQIGQRDDWLEPMLRDRYPHVTIRHIESREEATSLICAIDVVITTRFHLGILSALCAKPTILIEHELKMSALASDLSLPSVPMNDFISGAGIDLDRVIALFDGAKVAHRCEEMRTRAKANFDWMEHRRPT